MINKPLSPKRFKIIVITIVRKLAVDGANVTEFHGADSPDQNSQDRSVSYSSVCESFESGDTSLWYRNATSHAAGSQQHRNERCTREGKDLEGTKSWRRREETLRDGASSLVARDVPRLPPTPPEYNIDAKLRPVPVTGPRSTPTELFPEFIYSLVTPREPAS